MAIWLGVSLKMYFDHARTRAWTRAVVELVDDRPGAATGSVEVVVLPTFVSLGGVLDLARGSTVQVGAQDLSSEDLGAFTGEVSGVELAEIGCRYVEIGHHERRSLFGEDDLVVRRKTAAAVRNGLVPVLCVGEPTQGDPQEAAALCAGQVLTATEGTPLEGLPQPLVVAYEPHWAIGRPRPAGAHHVVSVVSALRETLASRGTHVRLVYGGSAGPGLLGELGGSVDGLFLGRFAHDPEAFGQILTEARELAQTT